SAAAPGPLPVPSVPWQTAHRVEKSFRASAAGFACAAGAGAAGAAVWAVGCSFAGSGSFLEQAAAAKAADIMVQSTYLISGSSRSTSARKHGLRALPRLQHEIRKASNKPRKKSLRCAFTALVSQLGLTDEPPAGNRLQMQEDRSCRSLALSRRIDVASPASM